VVLSVRRLRKGNLLASPPVYTVQVLGIFFFRQYGGICNHLDQRNAYLQLEANRFVNKSLSKIFLSGCVTLPMKAIGK
jgi:hypothetical protein